MSLFLYMDMNVQGPITRGLRQRSVTVLRAQDDGMDTADDDILLDHAGALGYVVFTQDVDFLIEVARRQRTGQPFSGVIYARQKAIPVVGD